MKYPMETETREKRIGGAIVRVHIPHRTLEEERERLADLDRVIRKAFPGRRLKMPDWAAQA